MNAIGPRTEPWETLHSKPINFDGTPFDEKRLRSVCNIGVTPYCKTMMKLVRWVFTECVIKQKQKCSACIDYTIASICSRKCLKRSKNYALTVTIDVFWWLIYLHFNYWMNTWFLCWRLGHEIAVGPDKRVWPSKVHNVFLLLVFLAYCTWDYILFYFVLS